jgi:hypothetical protein
MSWSPDGPGEVEPVSCHDWSCGENAQRDFLVWWMQNLPGRDNALGVGNWWDVIANFDAVVEHGFEPEEQVDVPYDCEVAC